MALGRPGEIQGELMVGWEEMPRSPGQAFYDRLQEVLTVAEFDGFVEEHCSAHYASRRGRPSLPPGRHFRMNLVGFFEGIDSKRGLEWRCSVSLSLRDFLRLSPRGRVPDHSWLSRTRARLPVEVHGPVFDCVLVRLAEHRFVKGERIGVDASTMATNAALRTIVRCDGGETSSQMLQRMAEESGIATPTTDDLGRLDREPKGKKFSNEDWTSPVDPDARVTKMKDGTTHLAYNPEHAVDLDTGAIVTAEVHSANRGNTATLSDMLTAAEARLQLLGQVPSAEEPAEIVADKGYDSRDVFKDLDGGGWKSRIAEKRRPEVCRWRGDNAARRADYNNRARPLPDVAKAVVKLRAELCGRSFALVLDCRGMQRIWLRSRANLHKRYLLHIAGCNLGLSMRLLVGHGTPRQAAATLHAAFGIVLPTENALILVVIIALVADADKDAVLIAVVSERGWETTSSTGCY